MEKRFSRNFPTLSESEQQLLAVGRAAIIGCGGLGGHIAELLARAGVGSFTLADGDGFDESNLNRQLLALTESLGENKARVGAERIKAINSGAEVISFEEFFTAENADAILCGADIVLDALDSIPARLLLEEKCAEKGLWLVHGAVEGLSFQVSSVPPGSRVLRRLYGNAAGEGGKSVLSPVPAVCAGVQCAEAVKKLCGREAALENRLLVGSLETMDFVTLDMG